jgi:8-oxo-dGTP pyrophosphatase MutT (NUDIX family)
MSSTASPNDSIAHAADFPERLVNALRDESRAGQRLRNQRFAPELSYGRHFGPAPATARAAAVIVLLFEREGRWHIPLTQRPDTLRHGGQISLPGGAVEPGETSSAAAARELFEELGIGTGVELLGPLSDSYVYVSNFLITPWLAVTRQTPVWQPHTDEVARVVELPLDVLLDEQTVCTTTIQRGPIVFRASGFRFGDDCIWGATAIILGELAGVLRSL